MITTKYDSREEWLDGRKGKITGSRLKDIVVKRGTGKKIGFYEIIAERLAIEEDGNESPMDRGTRLEAECMAKFQEETGKELDTSLVIWAREENENIAISPDASVVGESAAVEGKCLSSARHIEAYLTQQVPDEYEYQKIQYFAVNSSLERLYFAFYDPRLTYKSFFYLTIERADVEKEVEEMLAYQKTVLEEVEEIVTQLSF